MTTAICPYCKSEIRMGTSAPFMSQRKQGIYDAVSRAGMKGISARELLKTMYGDRRPPPGGGVVLRVKIHEINQVLAPLKLRIAAKNRNGYFLVTV